MLVAAYAPVAVIAGLRAVPAAGGWAAVAVGAVGTLVWIWFLSWLPRRQARESRIENGEFIDAEVTGYIVSILLPVVAASKPSTNDWIAYGICAVLILLVAFAAELWSVNPITYAFRMRAARAIVDGTPRVVLVRGQLPKDGVRFVARRVGVTLILD